MSNSIVLPAEWHPQEFIQLTWPHENTDWEPILDEVIPCYRTITRTIIKYQKLIIVCNNKQLVIDQLESIYDENKIHIYELPLNDTWARDHGPIIVSINNKPVIYDFTFNGWGMKFAANLDNKITKQLFFNKAFADDYSYQNMLHFVLEGGSIESDGEGTLLTTTDCLLSENRNEHLSKSQIENYLKEIFGLKKVLWLNNGYLAGDDTDSHIDTLARFCNPTTIAYVKCDDENDEHFIALSKMETELKAFKTLSGNPYNLIPLPMASPAFDNEGNRLPATYANFLIINKAVLFPTYRSEKLDELARKQLTLAFPNRDIIGIGCMPLIEQHGSLHCITMQYPSL